MSIFHSYCVFSLVIPITLFLIIVPLLCLEYNSITGYIYLSVHLSSWFQQGSHHIRVSHCLGAILLSVLILPGFCNVFLFAGKALKHQQVLGYSRKQESCFCFKLFFSLISILIVGIGDLFGVVICALWGSKTQSAHLAAA